MTIPLTYIIETERFKLRIPDESDFPRIYSATQFEGFNDGMLWDPPADVSELRAPLERSIQAWRECKGYSFTITPLTSDYLLGRISIRNIDQPETWDVGFWTHPEEQRKGIMTEVLPGVINFGFNKLNARRIVACHALWNIASEKLLKGVGMKFERYIEKGFMKKGKWVDENVLGIDRDDWINLSSNK